MYRANEAALVSAVLEATDAQGMIAAARQLWVTPVERLPDEATGEVWRAIDARAARAEAVQALLEIVRGRHKPRAAAFIDLVEALEDPAILFELAAIVLDAKWEIYPYLAAVFVRANELVLGKQLEDFIRANKDRLRADV